MGGWVRGCREEGGRGYLGWMGGFGAFGVGGAWSNRGDRWDGV